MKERIHWIDWAKALAVMTVVFCHLPQSQEFFYYRYLQASIIGVFFFLSGYLKKDRETMRDNWRKYWWGLIVPYLIYCALFYPYWIMKFYLQNGMLPDAFTATKPIIGALLLQSKGSFCEPLNGPLWYLPAILLMHLLIDACRRTKHLHLIMIGLCLLSVFVYAANMYWRFAPQLTLMGFVRRLPYYYIGYVLGRKHLMDKALPIRSSGLISLSALLLSIGFFYWHLQVMYTNFPLHIAVFYPFNICFLAFVFFGCQALNGYTPRWIENLSIGTLVIIGLHTIVIAGINLILSKTTSFTITEGYQWYEALPIALLITALLYPLILFAKRHAPIQLGRKQ